jgi:hypothetical protein
MPQAQSLEASQMDLDLNASQPFSRRRLLKLGAVAGVTASSVALGLPVEAAAASPNGIVAASGPATVPNVPNVAIPANSVGNVIGLPDLQAQDGTLTFSGTGAYSPGGFVLAPLQVPPGATLIAVTPIGTSSAGQTWDVFAENVLDGTFPAVAGFHGTTLAGANRFVNLSGSYTPIIYTRLLLQGVPSNSATNFIVGAGYWYIPVNPGFHAIPPARVYDSRLTDGRISGGTTRTISVGFATGGGQVVPPTASAILYNLTITDTLGAGFLALFPFGTAWPGNSSINWSGNGQTIANSGNVTLGGDRQVNVFAAAGTGGGSTQFLLDVTGYYL